MKRFSFEDVVYHVMHFALVVCIVLFSWLATTPAGAVTETHSQYSPGIVTYGEPTVTPMSAEQAASIFGEENSELKQPSAPYAWREFLEWRSDDWQTYLYLKPVSFEEAIIADAATMEKMYYPTGMQLPTKYWDIVSFAEFDGVYYVEECVAQFLQANWPSADGYTLAEVKAAQYFMEMLKYYETENKREDLQKLSEDICKFNHVFEGGNVVIDNVDLFRAHLAKFSDVTGGKAFQSDEYENNEQYRELVNGTGEDLLVYGRPVVYSWYDFNMYDPDGEQFATNGMNWVSTRNKFMAMVGVKFQEAPQSYKDYNNIVLPWIDRITEDYQVLNTGYRVIEEGNVGGVMVTPVEPEPAEEQKPLEESNPAMSKQDEGNLLGNPEGYSSNVTGADSPGQPVLTGETRKWNAEDILVRVALVVLLIYVIIKGVIDWQRKREDPTRNYPGRK